MAGAAQARVWVGDRRSVVRPPVVVGPPAYYPPTPYYYPPPAGYPPAGQHVLVFTSGIQPQSLAPSSGYAPPPATRRPPAIRHKAVTPRPEVTRLQWAATRWPARKAARQAPMFAR